LKAYSSFVPETYDSQTILSYLLKRFPYHTESEWSYSIQSSQVLVNGREVDVDFVLHKGDEVTYLPKDLSRGEPEINRDYSILFESENFLVVDKPPNIPVHPAGRYRTHTLLNLLENERGQGTCFPVHRLDRETSGVMIFAKQKAYQLMLQSLFEKRLVSKQYHIFVYGKFPESLDANGFIGKDPSSEIRKKQYFSYESKPGLKESNTYFERMDFDETNQISYIKVTPMTGRIHQIRATAFSLGYPVVGDKLYGKRESAFLDFVRTGEDESISNELGHARQALHASSLSFYDSLGERDYKFVSPLAFDLRRLLVSNS
jgi:23S rRNA pseudouridine955/2504/2580 synthase/23S rRNA pseudouridine1911/1915/1917 synthase